MRPGLEELRGEPRLVRRRRLRFGLHELSKGGKQLPPRARTGPGRTRPEKEEPIAGMFEDLANDARELNRAVAEQRSR